MAGQHGDTALHYAARAGNPDVARALLEHDANYTLRNHAGCMPMHVAVEAGDLRTQEALRHRALEAPAEFKYVQGQEWHAFEPAAACALAYELGEGANFSAMVTESGSTYIVDFVQRIQINLTTLYARSIAWKVGGGAYNFPERPFQGLHPGTANSRHLAMYHSFLHDPNHGLFGLAASPTSASEWPQPASYPTDGNAVDTAAGRPHDVFDELREPYQRQSTPSLGGPPDATIAGSDYGRQASISGGGIPYSIARVNSGVPPLLVDETAPDTPRDLRLQKPSRLKEAGPAVLPGRQPPTDWEQHREAALASCASAGSIDLLSAGETETPRLGSRRTSGSTSAPPPTNASDVRAPVVIEQLASHPGYFDHLDPESDELHEVAVLFLTGIEKRDEDGLTTIFKERGKKGRPVSITAVHHVNMPPARLIAFQHYRADRARVRGSANEKHAWHGASLESLIRIIKHGFVLAPERRLGQLYGRGVYLAPEECAYTSAQFAPVDQVGEQHLLLCRVILGAVEEIPFQSSQFEPSSPAFDNGVDKLDDPSRYIIWGRHVAEYILPTHIVSFRYS
eukprot:SM000027S09595  [mRNA]  locus=s27:230184:232722:+ [translate_table: standard]